jgi:hypothetical protein
VKLAIKIIIKTVCIFSITLENYVIPRVARDPKMQAPSHFLGGASLPLPISLGMTFPVDIEKL